jgi:hypothetical protein
MTAVAEFTAAGPTHALRERYFFSAMAITLALVVFAGFAPTFYLRSYFESANVLTPGLVVHGVVFSAWMALLVAQTALIAGRRADWHRRLGVLGTGLGAVMMIVGAYIAVTRARELMQVVPDPNAVLSFLTIPFGTLIVFPVLLGAALYYRRRAGFHKRLVIIATLEPVMAAVARLPGMAPYGNTGFFVGTDLLLVPIAVYDLLTLKRLHPATLWGGLFFIASEPVRPLVGDTAAWLQFARWIVG